MKKLLCQWGLASVMVITAVSIVHAQYIDHITDANRYELHFSHPLNEESISPDTHARMDYLFSNLGQGKTMSTFNIEFEYALMPSFSISASLPYEIINPAQGQSVSHTDNVNISLKFANYTFADHHVLLGYGTSFGLPTGSTGKGIGNSRMLNIGPFFNAGFMYGKWEWTAYATFGIPTHIRQTLCQCNDELNLQFATIYHVAPSLQGIFEAQRISELNGPNVGYSGYYLTEGFKYLVPHSPIMIGVGFRQPLSSNNEFKSQGLVSVFYDM